jgi:hypothetical protein
MCALAATFDGSTGCAMYHCLILSTKLTTRCARTTVRSVTHGEAKGDRSRETSPPAGLCGNQIEEQRRGE